MVDTSFDTSFETSFDTSFDTSVDSSVDTSCDARIDASYYAVFGSAYQIEDSSSSISCKPKTECEASIIKSGIKYDRSNKKQAIKDIDAASKNWR